MKTVRKNDPDRFLLSLFAPVGVRPDLWALYAFNYEIAKTREVVTETQLGLIRLQWWRDALAGIFERGEVLQHYVVDPLAAAIRKHNLPRELFDHLIYAREFDLEDRLPSNLEGMVKYAEFTSAPLLKLSLLCQAAAYQDDEIEKIATVYALTGLLRAIPSHARQQRCYLPEDMLRTQGTTAEDIYEGKALERLTPVTAQIFQLVRKIAEQVKDAPKFARRHLKLADMYLKQIEKAQYDVFSPPLQAPPFFKEIRLLLP